MCVFLLYTHTYMYMCEYRLYVHTHTFIHTQAHINIYICTYFYNWINVFTRVVSAI